jgi:hypothetical protein
MKSLGLKHNNSTTIHLSAKPPRVIGDERGMAMIEAVPLLVIFVTLIAYGLGMWGSVHTGILQSIGARTYAFESFRNKTNLTIGPNSAHYANIGIRYHGINDRPNPVPLLMAAQRPIALGMDVERLPARRSDHNSRIFEISGRNDEGGVEVHPIWIMIGYGMCLNANCGDQ